MAQRKSWDQLSDSYRKRLTNAGLTKADHAAGKSIVKARGHARTSEHGMSGIVSTARRLDIAAVLPAFNDLPKDVQRDVAEQWVTTFQRGKGRRNGHRSLSREQQRARILLINFLEENAEMSEAAFYKLFRLTYTQRFATAA